MIGMSPFVYIKNPNLPSFCVIDENPDTTGGPVPKPYYWTLLQTLKRPLKRVLSKALENIVMSFQGPFESFLALLSCRYSSSCVVYHVSCWVFFPPLVTVTIIATETQVRQSWALHQHSCKSLCILSFHFTALQLEFDDAAPGCHQEGVREELNQIYGHIIWGSNILVTRNVGPRAYGKEIQNTQTTHEVWTSLRQSKTTSKFRRRP